MKSTKISNLFNIQYPIISGGMVWVSGWRLASAVSESGGLGLIGAGSMKPDLLREHIKKCKVATSKPFGVNLPQLREDISDLIEVVIEENIKIVFTSAGHPGKHIERLKSGGVTVVHVVSNVKQGLKSQEVGCDAVVGEGVEAGGHNGPDEITTLCLIPQLVDSLKIPVIAAGGIADGRQIVACLALGASGVQIGTRFATSIESSAHELYKKLVVESTDNGTILGLRNAGLARMIKNPFSIKVMDLEKRGATKEEIIEALGRKREMMGIFEGNYEEGQFEAGQSSGLIKEILPVHEIFQKLLQEINTAKTSLN
ncbi:MAG: nitronate monooxygenase [Ignavibacteriales bacterium]|nr:nitronate monooxygenase [Ignavibacteriales bacterium]